MSPELPTTPASDVPHVPGSAYPDAKPAEGTPEAFYESFLGRALLFTGFLGPPLLWAIQFQANYGLIEWACMRNKAHVLQWINALFLVGAVAAGLLAFYIWMDVGPHWPQSKDEGIRARTRLLAVLGVLFTLLFMLLIFAQALPIMLFGPCEL